MSQTVDKNISQDIINQLIEQTAGIIGKKGVDTILKRLGDTSEKLDGKEIVFTFADEIQTVFGEKGSFATIRQLGREVAKSIMTKHDKNQWDELLEKSLNTFGFAYKIEKENDKAYICNCVFYDILEAKGIEPVKHSVCWCGWGFIEGFVREMRADVKSIKWIDRNVEAEKCCFQYCN